MLLMVLYRAQPFCADSIGFYNSTVSLRRPNVMTHCCPYVVEESALQGWLARALLSSSWRSLLNDRSRVRQFLALCWRPPPPSPPVRHSVHGLLLISGLFACRWCLSNNKDAIQENFTTAISIHSGMMTSAAHWLTRLSELTRYGD